MKCVSPDNFSSVAIPRAELEELVTTYQLYQAREPPVESQSYCQYEDNDSFHVGRSALELKCSLHLNHIGRHRTASGMSFGPSEPVSAYPYGLEAVEHPWKEVMSNKSYTFTQVLKILNNMGHDTECGACMAVAFTGASSTSEHTCKQATDPHDDTEPLFTLRAQDWIAPEIIREWAFRSLKLGSPIDKVDGARRIADAMENWQVANDKRKVAD